MRYFGWLPAGELRERMIPTPVGAACGWCKELVAEGDQGVQMPLMHSVGNSLVSSTVTYHRECVVRMILGSVGHMQGRCGCGTDQCGEGEGETDPPGMTVREAARAACELFDESRWRP